MSILIIEPQYDSRRVTFPQSFIDLGLDLVYPEDRSRVWPVNVGGVLVIGDATRANGLPLTWNVECIRVLDKALNKDMPVLATGMGLIIINELFGGQSALNVDGHIGYDSEGNGVATKHSLYVSPGSKSAAILGLGGFFKVNSQHMLGLKDADRAKSLLASAYSVEDGLVEGLESPQHDWVIGFQSNIELLEEGPRVFKNIFLGFKERSDSHGDSKVL